MVKDQGPGREAVSGRHVRLGTPIVTLFHTSRIGVSRANIAFDPFSDSHHRSQALRRSTSTTITKSPSFLSAATSIFKDHLRMHMEGLLWREEIVS